MSAQTKAALGPFPATLLLAVLSAASFNVGAQAVSDHLAKELETLSQRHGKDLVDGIRAWAEQNKDAAAALKTVFADEKCNWRVRLVAGAAVSCIGNPQALESTLELVKEIRAEHKAEPANPPEASHIEPPPTGQDLGLTLEPIEGPPIKSLPAKGSGTLPHRQNEWLRGLVSPIKGLTSEEAQLGLMVMLASSPRPLPPDGQPWDEVALAIAFRALMGLPPSTLMDGLVIEELKKVPLLAAERRWIFDYVKQRKLRTAVPVIRDSIETWTKAEQSNWPSRGAMVLAAVGGEEAEACLMAWSKHDNESYRLGAANALVVVGTPQAKIRLQYMAASDPLPSMRDYAKQRLEELESKPK